jgi:hypothetical protein
MAAVNSSTVKPGPELTDTPCRVPSDPIVTPDPFTKFSGRFCPPRTTRASSGSGSILPSRFCVILGMVPRSLLDAVLDLDD